MTHAIRFHKAGGPEVLVWEEVQLGKPGPGEEPKGQVDERARLLSLPNGREEACRLRRCERPPRERRH